MLKLSAVRSFIMDIFITSGIIVIAVYGLMAAYLYLNQRNILYVPAREMVEPHHYGLSDTTEVKLKGKDGIAVTAWFTPPTEDNNTVMIYFHGNAGNLADRTEKLKSFINTGMGVLALSYRGYGSSDGSPSEQGIYNDARATLAYAQELGFDLKNTLIYGESLGTGVAIQMATEYNVMAIVLEAPYTSIAARGKERYPFMPIDLLLKDKFDSLSKIKSVHVPVLIFHGYLDEVMPIHHGRRMLEAANDPKEARLFENKGHSDFDHDELARLTYEFAQRVKGTEK